VANNKEYIERVKMAVEHLHNCRASHCATMPVHEVFQGKTLWEGEVEVFNLTGHPKVKQAYAWSHADGKHDTDEKLVAELEIPQVESAQIPVKVAIVADSKSCK
jgi:hypothetical protein